MKNPRPACETVEEAKPATRISRRELQVFGQWLKMLNELNVPYILAGAAAFYMHSGIWRDTKDLDIFIQAHDLERVLQAFAEAGYQQEVRSSHWLAKVCEGKYVLDLIFGFWNGRMKIDESWMSRSAPAVFAGIPVRLISLEDLIASKMYVASRDRFDGSDIVHLIRRAEEKIDWSRVLKLVDKDYALVLWHLLLFDYVYPGEVDGFEDLIIELFEKVRRSWRQTHPPSFFRGPLIDPVSFKFDMQNMGFEDPRNMTPLLDTEGKML